jgi:DNA replication protein DnaC
MRGEHIIEVIMRRYENRSTIMTSNRPLEEWGKLLVDRPTAGAILDRFLHHAQNIAMTRRSYRLKDHATIAGKEDKNKKIKSKPNKPSTADPTS